MWITAHYIDLVLQILIMLLVAELLTASCRQWNRPRPNLRMVTMMSSTATANNRIQLPSSWLLPSALNPSSPNHVHDNREITLNMHNLILFEDKDILVVFKPPTVLTSLDQPTASSSSSSSSLDTTKHVDISILDLARNYLKAPPSWNGVIHRIDRPASGILLLAKHSKAIAQCHQLFANRKIQKDYIAIVNGQLPITTNEIVLEHFLRKSASAKTYIVPPAQAFQKDTTILRKDVVAAKLNYRCLQVLSRPSLKPETIPNSFQSIVSIDLDTGRKHQIRAQFNHMGHPIVGDMKYHAPQKFREKDIALHAYALQFLHPMTKEKMQFCIAPPKIWEKRFSVNSEALLQVALNSRSSSPGTSTR